MVYETIPIEAEDTGRVHILTGTIVSTDEGVAEVDIDDYGIFADVPVFYHCENSETADGMPFMEDDKVIIVNYGSTETLSVADMKVIGFEDGLPRECTYEFYICPTFNGFIPTVGGEQIKIEHPDYDSNDPEDLRSEIATTVVTGDFAGLCGPFTNKVDTGEEYISLGAGDYFAHYVEVPSEDASYHLGYSFPDWLHPPVKTFNVGNVAVEDAILHVNRVNWLRYSNILSGCSKTTETINDIDYSVYQVDFVELYKLTLTAITRYLGMVSGCNDGCPPVSTEPFPPVVTSGLTKIQGISKTMLSRIWTHGPLVCDDSYWTENWNCYRNHVSVFTLDKSQILILSNEFGQNPVYPGFILNTGYYISHRAIRKWHGRPEDPLCCGWEIQCEIYNTDYPGYGTYTYKMVLTPEDKF